MKKTLVSIAILFVVTASAFAHAGHVHKHLGTVTAVDGHAFTMTLTDGDVVEIQTSPQTVFTHADGHAARSGELAAGMRVVVTMAKDDKTAASVKMAAPAQR